MADGIDFRIVAVVIMENSSTSWTFICNDGFATSYSSWNSIPRFARDWLLHRNDFAHSIYGLDNGVVIVDKPLL